MLANKIEAITALMSTFYNESSLLTQTTVISTAHTHRCVQIQ